MSLVQPDSSCETKSGLILLIPCGVAHSRYWILAMFQAARDEARLFTFSGVTCLNCAALEASPDGEVSGHTSTKSSLESTGHQMTPESPGRSQADLWILAVHPCTFPWSLEAAEKGSSLGMSKSRCGRGISEKEAEDFAWRFSGYSGFRYVSREL